MRERLVCVCVFRQIREISNVSSIKLLTESFSVHSTQWLSGEKETQDGSWRSARTPQMSTTGTGKYGLVAPFFSWWSLQSRLMLCSGYVVFFLVDVKIVKQTYFSKLVTCALNVTRKSKEKCLI